MKNFLLGELIEITQGFPFDSNLFGDSGDLPLIRIRDVVPGRSNTYLRGACPPKHLIRNGDILIGMDGEFNRARWQGGLAALNQRVCRIQPKDERLDDGYLFHWLPMALKQIEAATPFVTVKHLSVKQLHAAEIPLLPLSEQRRIAAILDQAHALRAKRRAALTQLDQLSGAMFVDQFRDPLNNPLSINIVQLGDVCDRLTDGTHQPPKWSSGGLPFLFVKNIINGEIDFNTDKYISLETQFELTRRCPIEVGDVLYSTVGSYGVPALVRGRTDFSFQRHIAHIKPNRDLIDPEFLCVMLGSPGIREQADRAARGAAQKTINLGDLRSFQIFCPPLDTQKVFVSKIRMLKQLIVTQNLSRDTIDSLFASLQHRAFRGEL